MPRWTPEMATDLRRKLEAVPEKVAEKAPDMAANWDAAKPVAVQNYRSYLETLAAAFPEYGLPNPEIIRHYETQLQRTPSTLYQSRTVAGFRTNWLPNYLRKLLRGGGAGAGAVLAGR